MALFFLKLPAPPGFSVLFPPTAAAALRGRAPQDEVDFGATNRLNPYVPTLCGGLEGHRIDDSA
jgi:hypothetical protein